MPPIYTDKHIRTGIHDFKTNISKYIKELDSGRYEQLILTSRGTPIGGFITYKGMEARKERAKLEQLAGPLNGSDKGIAGLLNGLNLPRDGG